MALVPGGLTPRAQQLRNLSEQLPKTAQQQTQLQLNTQPTQMQQAVQGMGQPMTRQQLQQGGAASAAQRGAILVQGAQQAAQAAGTGAKVQLQQQQSDNQYRQSELKLGMAKQQRLLSDKLNSLDRRLKNELFDKELVFAKDEMGRELFNERQLLDWKLTQATSAEDLRNYEQQVRQMSSKKMKMLETALAKIKQTESQAFTAGQQQLDNAQRMQLAVAKAELEKKLAKEKANAANRASMFAAGGMIAGAVIGSAAGPAGAMAGASIGQGVGTMAASQT